MGDWEADTSTQTEREQVVAQLNNRPRHCLGWRTPNEVFFGADAPLVKTWREQLSQLLSSLSPARCRPPDPQGQDCHPLPETHSGASRQAADSHSLYPNGETARGPTGRLPQTLFHNLLQLQMKSGGLGAFAGIQFAKPNRIQSRSILNLG